MLARRANSSSSARILLLLLLLSHFSRVRLCVTLQTAAHQAPLSLGFSRQNTGVGCHFFLQCMKVKSESEVAQSCQTLSYPMDCSLPGSSVHGVFQAGVLEWGAIALGPILALLLRVLTSLIHHQPPHGVSFLLYVVSMGAVLADYKFLFSMNIIKFIYVFFSVCCTMQHVESQFPDQGSNLRPLHWKLRVLTTGAPVLVVQSCPTLCDPMNCSPPGPSAH